MGTISICLVGRPTDKFSSSGFCFIHNASTLNIDNEDCFGLHHVLCILKGIEFFVMPPDCPNVFSCTSIEADGIRKDHLFKSTPCRAKLFLLVRIGKNIHKPRFYKLSSWQCILTSFLKENQVTIICENSGKFVPAGYPVRFGTGIITHFSILEEEYSSLSFCGYYCNV